MKIPFFNYPSLYTLQKERIDKVINDVVSRGAYILQKDLEDFEKDFLAFFAHKVGNTWAKLF